MSQHIALYQCLISSLSLKNIQKQDQTFFRDKNDHRKRNKPTEGFYLHTLGHFLSSRLFVFRIFAVEHWSVIGTYLQLHTVCMIEETTKWNVHNLEWVSVLRLQWYFNEKIAAYLGKRVKPVPVRFKTLLLVPAIKSTYTCRMPGRNTTSTHHVILLKNFRTAVLHLAYEWKPHIPASYII